MPLYLQKSLRIEVLMMIGYQEQVQSQAEVAVLFSENHPELPPISQGTVSKIYTQYRDLGHVRDVKRQRQPRINEEDKLNLLLEYQEHPVTPARKVAREHGVSHTTVRKWLKDAKMHPYKIQLVHELNEDDPDCRVEYCERMMTSIDNGLISLKWVLFSDDATFTLHAYGHLPKAKWRPDDQVM
ncbi:hypothetical protein NQ315_005986 [Exocentrus adspersus]|uniref:Transposase n=1 Tax=Exocentrus adspersus TaxID=1586481 RepID=A0AAV8VBI4_9CUCU|nr:hypothetical protein NQ315_005986 [Exocentrus adspersus]